MSLINDALKKAQRLRHDGPADAAPLAPDAAGGAPIAKRSQPRSANTIVLIGGGAVVLVLLSVVVTLYLFNRTPATPPATTSPAPAPTPVTTPAASTPSAVAPATPLQIPVPTPAAPPPAPIVETKQPATPITQSPSVAITPTPTPATPTIAPTLPPTPAPAPAAAPAMPDERITAFVESVRVAGIRSSGTESRVLMNDRVFRVNDIVERTLGVRLVKVEVDSLTFADANGTTYVKYF